MNKVKAYTGRRILFWFIGFFLVIFLSNGIMTYFALKTWPGLVTENPYEKGLNYNQEIKNAEDQQMSNWQIEITDKPTQKTEGRFEINITRPEDSLPPARVTATFIRAVKDGFDQEVTLSQMGNSLYASPINLPLSGQWNVLIVVKSQNNFIYKMRDQFIVR